ncbi:glycosyl transferase [Spirochaetia bacterium]|nr:glycosyl transferase [Spirochaetia bacterium]
MLDASGIGVYIRECLPYFLSTAHKFFIIGSKDRLEGFVKEKANVTILDCFLKPFSTKEIIVFPKTIIKKINSGDIYYSPYFNIPPGIKVPIYTTIHDIIFPDMPEITSKPGLAARMFCYKRAYKYSKKIFTVSEFSKTRIQYFLGNKVPIVVTHSAIQPHFLNFDTSNIHKKETIIFIGNIKRHKGLWCLLDAFFEARAAGLKHKLIIVGEKNNFRSQDTESLALLENVDPSVVEFTGFISDTKLMQLLSEAALLVQPTLYEGFCLPPLEALVLGTKALISDIPVLKEIYAGYPVEFFKTGDSTDLKEKLLSMLLNKPPEHITLPHDLKTKYTFDKTFKTITENL